MSSAIDVEVTVRLVVDVDLFTRMLVEYGEEVDNITDQLIDDFNNLLDYRVNNVDKLYVPYTATIVKENTSNG